MSDYGYDARSRHNLRNQQISELRKHNPVARQIPTPQQPGITVFHISLKRPDNTVFDLRIALDKNFPHAPPVIQLTAKCTHPWLSKDGYYSVIGHQGLNKWNSHTSNLGRIVQEIVKEFCTRPPARIVPGNNINNRGIIGNTTTGPPTSVSQHSYQQPPTSNTPLGITSHHSTLTGSRDGTNSMGGGGLMPPSYSTGGTKSSNEPKKTTKSWSVPEVSTIFPEVQSLNASQIQSLIDNDDELDTFCDTVDGIKKLTDVLSMLRKKNGSAAEKNLSHEEEITLLKTEIDSLHCVLNEKKKAYATLVERQHAILNKSSPAELIRKLQKSADDLELESDELADEFVQDEFEGSHKDWQKRFLKSRKAYHQRVAMISRFQATNGR
jgi:ubiquitin-protein ligase